MCNKSLDNFMKFYFFELYFNIYTIRATQYGQKNGLAMFSIEEFR